jgi:hypothetical protein
LHIWFGRRDMLEGSSGFRDVARHPAKHRTAPNKKELHAQTVSLREGETP